MDLIAFGAGILICTVCGLAVVAACMMAGKADRRKTMGKYSRDKGKRGERDMGV